MTSISPYLRKLEDMLQISTLLVFCSSVRDEATCKKMPFIPSLATVLGKLWKPDISAA